MGGLTGGTALKMRGIPFQNVSTSTTIPVNGKAGDVYAFGGWSKASSIATENNTKSNGTISHIPVYQYYLFFLDSNKNRLASETAKFNPAVNDWQFVSGRAKTKSDYAYIQLYISYDNNAGDVYMTAPYVYKEEFGQSYDYDKDGNLKSAEDLANSRSTFAYNNKQLAKLANPTGSQFLYTSDTETRNLLYAQTTDGQRYEFSYDSYGNAISANVGSDTFATSLTAGKAYYIRNACSGNAMDNSTHAKGGLVRNWEWTPGNSSQMWKLIATSESDVYELCPTVNTGVRLDIKDASTANKAIVQLHTANGNNAQKFKIVYNNDLTFTIQTKITNYAKCIDGQPEGSANTENGSPVQQYANNGGDGQKWCFIELNTDITQKPYMTSTASYSHSGNHLSTITDTRGKTTTYNYDSAERLRGGYRSAGQHDRVCVRQPGSGNPGQIRECGGGL